MGEQNDKDYNQNACSVTNFLFFAGQSVRGKEICFGSVTTTLYYTSTNGNSFNPRRSIATGTTIQWPQVARPYSMADVASATAFNPIKDIAGTVRFGKLDVI